MAEEVFNVLDKDSALDLDFDLECVLCGLGRGGKLGTEVNIGSNPGNQMPGLGGVGSRNGRLGI